jgi:hypothetical protein
MMVYCQKLRKLENNFDSLEYLDILQGKMMSWMSWNSRDVYEGSP